MAEELVLVKHSQYLGRAKISIGHLHFEDESVPGSRCLDEKNIRRLLRVFATEGCQRLEPENFVPGIVGRDTLERVIAHSGTTSAALLDLAHTPPFLDLSGYEALTVLHGKHRIEAAKKHFHEGDCWWVIDLYSDQLSEAAILDLRSESANSRGFSDGDIFRHLRYHEKHGELQEVRKWQARLSPSKMRDVRTLASRFPSLSDAFDTLLPFTGLWAPLQLGTFHRILTMGCEDEFVHYLNHINETWSFILSEEPACLVDSRTVQTLQLLCPRVSLQDRSRVTMAMEARDIFLNIREDSRRSAILARIKTLDGRIPSLYSFFEDTKYLEPCADIMKSLLPSKTTLSIKAAFQSRFTFPDVSTRQASEDQHISIRSSHEEGGRIAYLQLWLFCMRHFPHMHALNPRKDTGQQKPSYELKQDFFSGLAQLASQLGFESSEILMLKAQDPLDRLVRAFVQSNRSPAQYSLESCGVDEHVADFCEFLRNIPKKQSLATTPVSVSDVCEIPLIHRCGRPSEKVYQSSRDFCFLHNVYSNLEPASGRYASSFTIVRDIFHSFFGDLRLPSDLAGSSEGSDDDFQDFAVRRPPSSFYSAASGSSARQSSVITMAPMYSPALMTTTSEAPEFPTESSNDSPHQQVPSRTVEEFSIDRIISFHRDAPGCPLFYSLIDRRIYMIHSNTAAAREGAIIAFHSQGHYVLQVFRGQLCAADVGIGDDSAEPRTRAVLHILGLKGSHRQMSSRAREDFDCLLREFHPNEEVSGLIL